MDLIYSFCKSNVELWSPRFRSPKSMEQERSMLIGWIPKITCQSTKWSVKVFEDWQHARKNKNEIKEKFGVGQMDFNQSNLWHAE